MCRGEGELGEAVGKYKEALNLSQGTLSESLELYYLLGSVFERLGDVREALYFFENLRKRDATFRDVGGASPRSSPPARARGGQTVTLDDRAAAFFQELQDRTRRGSRPRRRRSGSARTRGRGPRAAAGARACWPTGRPSRRRASRFSDVYGTLRPEMARALPGEGRRFARPASR